MEFEELKRVRTLTWNLLVDYPSVITEILQNYHSDQFRYASNLNFYVPRVRSNCGKHSFEFAITIFREEIPTSLKTLSYYQFKKQRKRILLTLKGNNLKWLFLIILHSYHGT